MPPCPIFTAPLPLSNFPLFRFDLPACASASALTKSGDFATSFLTSFTIDIDVGPDGLTTPKSADMAPSGVSFGMMHRRRLGGYGGGTFVQTCELQRWPRRNGRKQAGEVDSESIRTTLSY